MEEELRVTRNIREAKERRERGEGLWRKKGLDLGDIVEREREWFKIAQDESKNQGILYDADGKEHVYPKCKKCGEDKTTLLIGKEAMMHLCNTCDI